MSLAPLHCRSEARRDLVRASDRCGIDYVEISADRKTLYVHLLGNAPEELRPGNRPENIRHLELVAPPRVRRVALEAVVVRHDDAPDRDDVLEIVLDGPGDLATYVLRLVDVTKLDAVYAQADVDFTLACPSELDCRVEPACPGDEGDEPEIDYLAKDYAGFRRLILDRLALIMPAWRERHVPDVGIALSELLAYVGDELSYFQDAVATEAYIGTAHRRISVRRHGRLVDFSLHEGCNARAWVCVETREPVEVPARDVAFVTVPDADGGGGWHEPLAESALPQPPDAFGWYEPVAELATSLAWIPERNTISIHTWGDTECCLPSGATSAALRLWRLAEGDDDAADRGGWDAAPLTVGDVLVFEEVKGPVDGRPESADRGHRQAVRLTSVRESDDALLGWHVAVVMWGAEDALRFPLCVSALGSEDCRLLEDVSVARGNVVLVDHGRRLGWAPLGEVGSVAVHEPCEDIDWPGEVSRRALPFRPRLARRPLTFRRPIDTAAPAARLAGHEAEAPRDALPALWVRSDPPGPQGPDWQPVRHLLASTRSSRHVVVEVDDQQRAHLRFGDGELGAAPAAGSRFEADQRVGNGRAGNAGAGAIARLVLRRGRETGRSFVVRNPLPAVGGVDPEPLAEARLLAPGAARATLERAITAEDYASLAEQTPGVQRAAAELRWFGAGYEARVAVDPYGTSELDEALRRRVARRLQRYRRIGHDVRVVPAEIVPLWIELEVCVQRSRIRGQVRAALLDALGNRALPDGRRGMFHPDRITFGEGVRLSALVATAMTVPGVDSVTVTRLQRRFGGPRDAIARGVLPLGPLEVARLDNDPAHPENGVLELCLWGGR